MGLFSNLFKNKKSTAEKAIDLGKATLKNIEASREEERKEQMTAEEREIEAIKNKILAHKVKPETPGEEILLEIFKRIKEKVIDENMYFNYIRKNDNKTPTSLFYVLIGDIASEKGYNQFSHLQENKNILKELVEQIVLAIEKNMGGLPFYSDEEWGNILDDLKFFSNKCDRVIFDETNSKRFNSIESKIENGSVIQNMHAFIAIVKHLEYKKEEEKRKKTEAKRAADIAKMKETKEKLLSHNIKGETPGEEILLEIYKNIKEQIMDNHRYFNIIMKNNNTIPIEIAYKQIFDATMRRGYDTPDPDEARSILRECFSQIVSAIEKNRDGLPLFSKDEWEMILNDIKGFLNIIGKKDLTEEEQNIMSSFNSKILSGDITLSMQKLESEQFKLLSKEPGPVNKAPCFDPKKYTSERYDTTPRDSGAPKL